MSHRVAIVQSNYIPWKGYFDLIRAVDEFILLDEAQYTRRDWRNRNRIRTQQGTVWLTVPVEVKGKYDQRIDETTIADTSWTDTHWKTLTHTYRRAPHFERYEQELAAAYADAAELTSLSEVNRLLLSRICGLLGITAKLSWSTDYESRGVRTERLVSLCQEAGATDYLSGPAAREYLDCQAFTDVGVDVSWASYEGYSAYPQVHGEPFEHGVTILDLLFNTGPDAEQFLMDVRVPTHA